MTSFLSTLALSACSECPDPNGASGGDDTGEPGDGGSADGGAGDGGAADEALTADERDALATWVSAPVSMTLVEGGPSLSGDRVAILIDEAVVGRLDVVTTATRAQDHNSSRSNKSSVIASDDALYDEDTSDPDSFAFAWDGASPCTELPCVSPDRPDDASSRLVIVPGDGLADGYMALTWGETTPMDVAFSGTVTLGFESRFRGHVTVLKASSTDDGNVVITSALESQYMAVFDGDTSVYEGKPGVGTTPLAVISGIDGASWPKGVAVEETAMGTLISLTW